MHLADILRMQKTLMLGLCAVQRFLQQDWETSLPYLSKIINELQTYAGFIDLKWDEWFRIMTRSHHKEAWVPELYLLWTNVREPAVQHWPWEQYIQCQFVNGFGYAVSINTSMLCPNNKGQNFVICFLVRRFISWIGSRSGCDKSPAQSKAQWCTNHSFWSH